ncbi:hypothetical protein RND81_02G146100 [Saponaria officinalis]|uniref:Uncharacterized protein n=1 Tax=Saponaria officinalis TaxID=3572 RepID=A0AAW1MUK8_SAPOF
MMVAFSSCSFVGSLCHTTPATTCPKPRELHSTLVPLVRVSSFLLALVLVGRVATIFLNNLTRKAPEKKIEFTQQVIILWAVLMSGYVSMALASGYMEHKYVSGDQDQGPKFNSEGDL